MQEGEQSTDSSEARKRRRGTALGLLLLRTETENHRSVQTFIFTLRGAVERSVLAARIAERLCCFERFRSVLVGGSTFVESESFSIDDHCRELTREEIEADAGVKVDGAV